MTDLLKPKVGQPCNGCGLCCKIQVCRNGAYVQGLVTQLGETVPGPCPALTKMKDGTYSCGIVLQPKRYFKKHKYREDVLRREFMFVIGAGTGCDEIGYDDDPIENQKIDDIYNKAINDQDYMNRLKNSLRILYDL